MCACVLKIESMFDINYHFLFVHSHLLSLLELEKRDLLMLVDELKDVLDNERESHHRHLEESVSKGRNGWGGGGGREGGRG